MTSHSFGTLLELSMGIKSEIFAAVKTVITVFYFMKQCSLVRAYKLF
jgi:hypothetical protein